ncbi:hypothetical protein SAMN05444413_101499 [Roseivivax marinus]|nr:hypothetical protein SAMN05444413_101499 [Roseivivax marinus]
MLLVGQVPQAVEGAFIARRRDVQAASGFQLHARRAEVKLDALLVRVPNPQAGILVMVEPGECQLFEPIHDLPLFLI